MVDPLRPLLGFVESIARIRKINSPSPETSVGKQSTSSSSLPQTNSNSLSFTQRLTACLAETGEYDRKQRRKLFVKIALSSELGDELAMDPTFTELVEEVCVILANDPKAISSLDILLEQFQNTETTPRSK